MRSVSERGCALFRTERACENRRRTEKKLGAYGVVCTDAAVSVQLEAQALSTAIHHGLYCWKLSSLRP